MRYLLLMVIVAVAAACGKKPVAGQPRAGTCDPMGSWEFAVKWQDGACPGAETPWNLPILATVTRAKGGAVDFTGGSAWGHSPIIVAALEVTGCTMKVAADSDTREDPPSWVKLDVQLDDAGGPAAAGTASLKRAECTRTGTVKGVRK